MNKRCILLMLTVLCLGLGAGAQVIEMPRLERLGDSARASLLTCGPGNEFYTSFGHTALRVRDPEQGVDWVYNYGVFEFTDPLFYLRFASGKMDYWVECIPFEFFMFDYQWERRDVWEQELRLSNLELNWLFDALNENTRPENMYYTYDFFRDNCASRAHRIIQDNLERSHIVAKEAPERQTFRGLLHAYTKAPMRWWMLGYDILLGARCDQALNTEQYIFIPLEMMRQYDTTPITQLVVPITPADSVLAAEGRVPLCEPTRQLMFDHRPPMRKGLSPTLTMWVLLALTVVLTVVGRRKGWKLNWLDLPLFWLCGLFSLLLLYLWFGSSHWCTKWNFDLLWANPLLLWIACRWRKRNGVATWVMVALMGLLAIAWCVSPSVVLNPAVLPIMLILATRLVDRSMRAKQD